MGGMGGGVGRGGRAATGAGRWAGGGAVVFSGSTAVVAAAGAGVEASTVTDSVGAAAAAVAAGAAGAAASAEVEELLPILVKCRPSVKKCRVHMPVHPHSLFCVWTGRSKNVRNFGTKLDFAANGSRQKI